MIPEPLSSEWEPSQFKDDFLQRRFGTADDRVTFFLPQASDPPAENALAGTLAVLEAFVLADAPESTLLIETTDGNAAAIAEHAGRLGVAKQVVCVEKENRDAVMQNVDVVIATGELPADPVLARRANDHCLHALALGKALLAANIPRNRECSPEGAGCLWFQDGDMRELGHRIKFLAENHDFRAALGDSGRKRILENRNSTTIGQQYDAAYRHAIKQKRASGPGNHVTNLQPLTSGTW
jgi:glycosyltransferase involved in cell wall biosynthesis